MENTNEITKIEEKQLVLKSVRGFNVKKKDFDNKIYLKYICEKENKIVAEMLASRNILPKDKNDYLEPKLKNLLPALNILKDVDLAVKRILEAIEKQEQICIFGDYDVDGTTSTAMFVLFLEQLGIQAKYYIPDRLNEGYGPNVNAIERIHSSGIKLLICVDCGTTAFEPLEKAKTLGMDVIVIDHHKSADAMPACAACVNPNRIDETEIDDNLHCLCACGVSFLVLMSLASELKNQNQPVNLLQFVPLVAFATICDVMTLTKLNRAFIRTGISVEQKNKQFNLQELLNATNAIRKNKIEKFSSYAFGFILGPMINAGGRIGNSSLGVELLIEKNKQTATIIAEKLNSLNEERKNIETEILNNLIYEKELIQRQIDENGFVLMCSNEWHEGVIGLIASRIKDKFLYPTIIGSQVGDKIKFSARSVNGVDIGKIVLQAREENILTDGGGHELAAGFSCLSSQVDNLRNFLKEKIKRTADDNFESKTIEYDVALSLGGLNNKLLKEVEKFEPFGTGNPKPIFLIQDAIVINAKAVHDKHISLIIKDAETTNRAICFNCIETELGKTLLGSTGKTLSFLVNANIENWHNEERISIQIIDTILN